MDKIDNSKVLRRSYGFIAHNDPAPKDKASRWYIFTSGGICPWITGGPETVKQGDSLYVTYSGGAIYNYEHIASPKVDQVDGKGLSTLDYTPEEKESFVKKLPTYGVIGDYAIIAGSFKLYAHIPFTVGTVEILPGQTLVGATSEASYIVKSVVVDTGDWATGSAEGHVVIDARANYLDAPYTDDEVLQVEDVPVAIRGTAPAYGGWVMKSGINITSIGTSASSLLLNHPVNATEVIAMTVGAAGDAMGHMITASQDLDASSVAVSKLAANTETGIITSSSIDFTNLANCTTDATLSVFGIVKL